MLARRQIGELGQQVGERAAPSEHALLERRAIGDDIIGHPAHAVTGADERLVKAIGKAHRRHQLGAERRAHRRRVAYKKGETLRAGNVRGGVGRKRRRVNRDAGAAHLQQARRRQADCASAEDRDPARIGGEREAAGLVGGAPRERDAAAAVAVVVHE
jgi:hypothetical protein